MKLRTLLRIVGPTLAVAIGWFGLATATNGAIDESERAAETTARAVAGRQRVDGDLVAFAEVEVEALAAIERIEAVIPSDVDVPQLIALLAATDQADLAVEVISPNPAPQPLSAAGALSRVEVGVSGNGTYEATLAYLDRLAQSERLFRIRSVELNGEGGGDRVRFTLQIDAFTTMAPDPAATAATAAAPGPTTTAVPTPVIAFEEE